MRKLEEVIEEIKKVSTKDSLNEEMEEILKDIGYTPPEFMDVRWKDMQRLINKEMPPPLVNDEDIKIVSIFTRKTEEQVRKQYQ